MANILLIEDDENLRLTVERSLAKQHHTVTSASSITQARQCAAQNHFDLVLSDVNLGDESGIDFIEELRAGGFVGSIVLMTAYANVDDAVKAMKLGADDYLAKPIRMQELNLLCERLLKQQTESKHLRLYKRIQKTNQVGFQPIGQSPTWLEAKKFAERVAQIPVGNRGVEQANTPGGALTTILVTGKTGTGKGVIARYIHASSPEHELPFVHVNCTALPPTLVESELFGHEKGAFTDAKSSRDGLFEMADGGTIFLDEIGDLDLALQAKLLSVIEDGRIRRVGSSKERPVRVRVIAATNRDLAAMVKDGTFREDLLFRINAFSVVLPDLRDRGDDSVLIARSLLDHLRNEYRLEPAKLSDDAESAIRGYSWPGNVRELFNAVQRAAMLASSNTVEIPDLHIGTGIQDSKPTEDQNYGHGELNFDFDATEHTAMSVERELMIQALTYTNGNVSKASKLIGMQRSSFRYRLERYKISPMEYTEVSS
ncbi:MAG: sigma-54-dependent transcriptional regulator [Phycisphaerales bacterium]